ncbi:MAG: translation initiation factor IF-2 subunit alpha [Candidatus Thermoplasmatota archaeon]
MPVVKKEYPEEGELIVGTVKNVRSFGAFVTLDEYPGKEGFIHIAEIATGWVKRITKHVKENQKIVCKVMDVDPKKGHVDLSLKRVNEHQKREKIQEWKNNQKAEKLMERLADKIDKNLDECYEEFGYDLIKKYGSMYAAFEEAKIDIETLKKDGFDGDWLEKFHEIAENNITIPFVNIKGYMDVRCWLPDGIDYIRKALMKAEGSEYDDVEIKVKYVGAPHYMITIKAPDYKIAEKQLKKAVGKVENYITENEGEFEFHRKLEE